MDLFEKLSINELAEPVKKIEVVYFNSQFDYSKLKFPFFVR